ncbi:hypothetical protein PR048_022109 [Dryococelus australis]|uniref:Uncharacterized protein n=1 Tax=Dryococelus australis TaxID=614101 RepID=A0ABQ9H033_9NEOP|nr:hypothetical protein PR048_022109 [Dryococelus australis]
MRLDNGLPVARPTRRAESTNDEQSWQRCAAQSGLTGGLAVAVTARLSPRRTGFNPRPVHSGFSHVGIVPDDEVGQRDFSGISRFPPPFHSGAATYSPHFTLIRFQDLDVKSRPNLFTHSLTHSLRTQSTPKTIKVQLSHCRHIALKKSHRLQRRCRKKLHSVRTLAVQLAIGTRKSTCAQREYCLIGTCGTRPVRTECSLLHPFTVTCNFSEALLTFYFQDISPHRANKVSPSLENYTKGTAHGIRAQSQRRPYHEAVSPCLSSRRYIPPSADDSFSAGADVDVVSRGRLRNPSEQGYSQQAGHPARSAQLLACVPSGEKTSPTKTLGGGRGARWLVARSPPTKANWAQSPAGSLRILPSGNRVGRCRWSAGFFSGISRFPPPTPSFRRRSVFSSINLIGSQDLAWWTYVPYCVNHHRPNKSIASCNKPQKAFELSTPYSITELASAVKRLTHISSVAACIPWSSSYGTGVSYPLLYSKENRPELSDLVTVVVMEQTPQLLKHAFPFWRKPVIFVTNDVPPYQDWFESRVQLVRAETPYWCEEKAVYVKKEKKRKYFYVPKQVFLRALAGKQNEPARAAPEGCRAPRQALSLPGKQGGIKKGTRDTRRPLLLHVQRSKPAEDRTMLSRGQRELVSFEIQAKRLRQRNSVLNPLVPAERKVEGSEQAVRYDTGNRTPAAQRIGNLSQHALANQAQGQFTDPRAANQRMSTAHIKGNAKPQFAFVAMFVSKLGMVYTRRVKWQSEWQNCTAGTGLAVCIQKNIEIVYYAKYVLQGTNIDRMHLGWCWTPRSTGVGGNTVGNGGTQTSNVPLGKTLAQLAQLNLKIRRSCRWPKLSSLVPDVLGRIEERTWSQDFQDVSLRHQGSFSHHQCEAGIVGNVTPFHDTSRLGRTSPDSNSAVVCIQTEPRFVAEHYSSPIRKLPCKRLHVLGDAQAVMVDVAMVAVTTDSVLLTAYARDTRRLLTTCSTMKRSSLLVVRRASDTDPQFKKNGPSGKQCPATSNLPLRGWRCGLSQTHPAGHSLVECAIGACCVLLNLALWLTLLLRPYSVSRSYDSRRGMYAP